MLSTPTEFVYSDVVLKLPMGAGGRGGAILGLALLLGIGACSESERARGADRRSLTARLEQRLILGEPQRLIAPVPSYVSQFGNSVALDGDTAAVAAREGAYVYRLTGGTWELEGEFHPNVPGSGFSDAIAISGNRIAFAGYCYWPPSSGGFLPCAQVYVRTGSEWRIEQPIIVTRDRDPSIHDAGVSVALHGETLFLGSSLHNAVFMYELAETGWTERQAIAAPDEGDAGSAAYLGLAMSLGSDTAILGRPVSGNNSYFRGFAYAFVRSGSAWVLQQSLVPSGPRSSVYGTGVALSQDTAVVGEWTNGGPVRVFTRRASTWSEEQTLSNLGGTGPVAVDGNTLAFIGRGDQGVSKLYVFHRQGSTWTPSASYDVHFSAGDLALSTGWLLVGQGGDTANGVQYAGSVLAFRLSEILTDAGSDAEAGLAEAGPHTDASGDGDAGTNSDVGTNADASTDADAGTDADTTDAVADAVADVGFDTALGDGRIPDSTPGDGRADAASDGSGGRADAGRDSSIPPDGAHAGAGGMGGTGVRRDGGPLAPSRGLPDDSGDGCGCRLHDAPRGGSLYAVALLLTCLTLRRRRRPT